jgi:hypothetical protein
MTMQLTSHDVDGIKRELGHLLSDVKSSHRVEAMARGLGFQTNASLRALLQNGQADCTVGDSAFETYLIDRGFPKPPYATLTEAVSRVRETQTRQAIAAVMDAFPELSSIGFDVYDGENKTESQRQADFEESRAQMLTSRYVEQFKHCVALLSTKPKSANFNTEFTTYKIKHAVERHLEGLGIPNFHISNGMLIAAAAHLGFQIKRRDFMSAYLNIDWTTPLPSDPALREGTGSRAKAGRNMMVAAVNAGIEQKLFGLAGGENFWEGHDTQFKFEVAGLEALAYVTEYYAGGPLLLHIAVRPTFRVDLWIEHETAGLYAGDAFIVGWLERERGTWVQKKFDTKSSFRNAILPILTNVEVEPQGFADGAQPYRPPARMLK